jgi:tetratricopeptide (TPR) repeat protein
MDKNLKTIQGIVLLGVAFIIPLLFLPIFPNYLVTPKLVILVLGVITLLVLFFARIIINKKFELQTGKFDIPLLVIFVGTLLSAFLRTPNRMEAFFLPGTATIILAGILYYFMLNQVDEKVKKQVPLFIYYAAIPVALLSLLSISKALGAIPGIPSYLKDVTFTTIGGNFGAFIFLVAMVPTGLYLSVTEKSIAKKAFYFAALLVVTLGIAGNLYNILPGKSTAPQNITTAMSWSIAIDTIKESPLLGAGPANFLTAFNRFRPVTFNQSANWNLRFVNSNSTYLTMMTELGLVGLAALLVLLVVIFNKVKAELEEKKETPWGISLEPETLSLTLAAVLLAVSNATIPMFLVFFAFLSVAAKTRKYTFNLESQEEGKMAAYVPAILISLPFFLAIGFILFTSVKVVRAEVTYNKALDAVSKNDGKGAYELLAQAVSQNQMVDRYHATAAQIDFALANSIASKPQGEKITDEERNTITQLIQQAIAEGKAVVSLNPTRAGNWSLLANLYQSVMAFAEGSDQFAIQTYNQAIALDPLDPNLRLSLGGIYFALGNYDSAIDAFKTAVMTKGDLANARYNLAVAYREKGDLERAIAEMTVVTQLVDRSSNDYETAKKELTDLEAKRPAASPSPSAEGATGPETLATPAPTQKPVMSPPIELPADAQPPAASPVPSPTPTIEP